MVWWLVVLMVNPDEKWLNAAGEVGGDRAIASPPHTHTLPSLCPTGPAGLMVVSSRAWDIQLVGTGGG